MILPNRNRNVRNGMKMNPTNKAKLEKYEMIRDGLELSIKNELTKFQTSIKRQPTLVISLSTARAIRRNMDKLSKTLELYEETVMGINGIVGVGTPKTSTIKTVKVEKPSVPFFKKGKKTDGWTKLEMMGKSPVYKELVTRILLIANGTPSFTTQCVVKKIYDDTWKLSTLTTYVNIAMKYSQDKGYICKTRKDGRTVIYGKGDNYERGCNKLNVHLTTENGIRK